jgi:predicted amidohydrolase YtcJ
MATEGEILLYNARIYTLDAKTPVVTAVWIRGDRVLGIGRAQDFESALSAGAQRLDLGGKTVIPGLTDAHLHLELYALGLTKVDCETRVRAECLRRVAEQAAQLPPGEWVLGHGWNQNNWPEGFGTAADLDAVAPDNPVYLTAKSLHAAWANSRAMRAANISAATPDPVGGRLGRTESGQPDGLFFENAMGLVSSAIPEPTLERVAEAISAVQPGLLRMGVTSVHDFDRRQCFSALQILRQRGDLRIRVVKNIPLEDLSHAVALGLRYGLGDLFLRVGAVKVFADGALGPRTAAMLEPFLGEPHNRGMLLLDSEAIFEHGRLALENGLPLAVHAIGDRANREVLDAFAQLRAYESAHMPGELNKLRHRIEHVQLLHPQDTARLSRLGIIASMQPIHATSDMEMTNRYWGARAALAYAFHTQVEHGAVIAFGSDAPVENPNPFLGLHAAVTRRRIDGSPGEQGWHPEQRISVKDTLRAYTYGPAYAAGLETQLGALSPGYLADLLVLNSDPFRCPANELHQVHPLATMVAGRWRFRQF